MEFCLVIYKTLKLINPIKFLLDWFYPLAVELGKVDRKIKLNECFGNVPTNRGVLVYIGNPRVVVMLKHTTRKGLCARLHEQLLDRAVCLRHLVG